MITLALDTSSALTSVAVCDGETALHAVDRDAPARHGEVLAPAIAEVLAAAGLSARDLGRVVAGVGPGPFTGLRVGLMTARAMGHALELPVVGVVSLDTLAAQVVPERRDVLVVTDARRKEVYWATYDAVGGRSAGPGVARATTVVEQMRVAGFHGLVVGPGARLYADAFAGLDVRPDVEASASWAGRLAAAGRTTDSTAPLYLRRPDAQAPGAPKSVLA